MNADLKHLIRLQGIDISIQEIRTRIDAFPAESKALDAKLRSANEELERIKEAIKANQAGRKKLEGEVGAQEQKISKYREQMMSVKTNEEYKTFQREIEHAQTAIRKTEDDIIGLMMELEALQVALKKAESQLKEDQQVVNSERKVLEGESQKDMSSLEGYVRERQEIERSISADLLPRYERVRKARGGLAVAAAREYMCEVCQVRIRPQVFQEIRKNDQIIACDACQRILYDPENMDHPFEVA
jgi:predicted  nucleic acid-binding Zn-ribbon protein